MTEGGSHWAIALLMGVLLVALAVRGASARHGLPYLHHYDEPAVVHHSFEMVRTGSPDPGFYRYGTLLFYLAAAADAACFLHLAARPVDDPEAIASLSEVELGEAFRWFVSHPTFVLWNRWVVVLFGVAAVFLAHRLTREVARGRLSPAGTEAAALAAAGLLATLGFHIEHSTYVTTDVPASTLAVAAVWLALVGLRRSATEAAVPVAPWLASAAAAGFAASTKYNAGLSFVVPLAALAVATARPRTWAKPPTWLWPALPAVAAAAFLAGTPYAILGLPRFLEDVAFEIRHYVVNPADHFAVAAGWPHLAGDLAAIVENAWRRPVVHGSWAGPLSRGLDWAISLTALAGLGAALAAPRPAAPDGAGGRRRPDPRLVAALAFLLPVAQLLATARTQVDFHRNVMVVYPFFAAAFGLGAVLVARTLGRRLGRRVGPGRRRALRAAGVAAVVLLIALRLASAATRADRRARPESRSLALAEAARLARGEEAGRVAKLQVAAELRAHPVDLAELPVPWEVLPLTTLACFPEPGTLVVVPRRFETFVEAFEPRRRELARRLAGAGEPLAEIGGGRPLVLERFSVHPGVAVRRPFREPAVRDLACAQRLRPTDVSVEGSARHRPGSLLLGPGGAVVTPFFAADPGMYEARWWDARRGRASPELEAEVLVRPPGDGDPTPVSRAVFTPGAGQGRALAFELLAPSEVALRIAASASPEGAAAEPARQQRPMARIRDPELRPSGGWGPREPQP